MMFKFICKKGIIPNQRSSTVFRYQFSRRFQSTNTNSGIGKSHRLIISLLVIGGIGAGIGGYTYGKTSILSNLPSDSFPLESTTKLENISPPKYCNDEELKLAIEEVIVKIGDEKISNTVTNIESHSDNGFNTHSPEAHQRPKYIIYPESTQDVIEIMKIMNKYSVPVVPYSGGTSLEGHLFSTRAGVVIDTSKMNKILEVHADDLDAVVQAGVNWQELNEYLLPENLMLGTDCGPNGLISGMINTNASGINASRYGAMISNVISITVVLADGTLVKTKQRPRKSSAGYNLTGLFVGSEGTLGIVTEATVKLHVKPKHETVVVGQFETILDATNAVAQIFREGINPNAIELLDKDMMHCINYCGYFTKHWLEVPTIFFKIGGINEKVIDENVKELKKISMKHNCQDFIFASNEEEKEELFSARKNAFYAILDYGKNEIDENVKLWVTDIAVPLSRLSPVLNQLQKLVKESGLQSILLGHVGDSNIHYDIFYTEETKQKCKKLVSDMMIIGLKNEGTSSGEHGIGNGKRKYLEIELGTDAIDLMRRLKFALDPKRILNPDKIFRIDPNDDGEF